MSVDPGFLDAGNGDYQLRPDSQMLNAGILQSWMAGAVDLAGDVRVRGGVPDIGCYEGRGYMGSLIIFR